MLLVGGGAWGATVALELELGDTLSQFGAGAMASRAGFEDAGTQELGDELKLIGGEPTQEFTNSRFSRLIGTAR